MGFSLAWIAVQTRDHAALFEQARARPTDEADDYFKSPISGAELDGGWFLLVGRGCDHRLINRSLLASVSARWPCVACSAAFWRGGVEVWSASHDAQEGIFNLVVSGELPGSFAELRQRKFREQDAEGRQAAEVDLVFDVPLLLAKELTGFKHDEEPTCLAQPTPVAFIDEAPRRPWWKLW